MTRLLELAIEAVRHLSDEEQDQIARMILDIVGGAEEDVQKLAEAEDEEAASKEVTGGPDC